MQPRGVVIGASIVSAATATEIGATGVRRQPWANAPFIPGSLGDYMEAQFTFFGSDKISADKRPILAGLNYFLTHEARGGNSINCLGRNDVKAWMAWLERQAHGDVEAIQTPIGDIPKFEDLKALFSSLFDTKGLYGRIVQQAVFPCTPSTISSQESICRSKLTAKRRTFRKNCSIYYKNSEGELVGLTDNMVPLSLRGNWKKIRNHNCRLLNDYWNAK